MSDKIPVGVSACLLGENVRFDGGHKRLPFAVDELSPLCASKPCALRWRLVYRRHAQPFV